MTLAKVSPEARSVPRTGIVLIVTDRPDEAEPLARRIGMVLDCAVTPPLGSLPQTALAAIVLDVAPHTPMPARGLLAEALASDIPVLVLARDQDAVAASRAQALGAAAILPAASPRAATVAVLLKIADLHRPSRRERSARTAARAAEASDRVANVLQAAGTGRPVSTEEADRGTAIVLAAIEDAGIRAWLEVVWAHDDHLYQHVLSVTGYAAAFAHALGFTAGDQLRLAKAALLHDVGKMRIPRAILDKPGRLDAAEMAVMRAHPAIGADLLARQPGFDAGMIDVVRHHHEMLDGSGYPDGLSGPEITDLVRLVTICDIYPALTERRPYRAPMPGAAAYAHLEGMTGKIDAALLRAFRPVHAQASRPAEV